MNQTDFIHHIWTLKEESDEEYTIETYYIFIDKNLKHSKMNKNGSIPISDFGYLIVVAPYKWSNFGYTNTSLKMIGIYNRSFEPVESIPFDKWKLTSLDFILHSGQFYNAWCPLPFMVKQNNSNETTNDYLWEDKEFQLDRFDEVLESIWFLEKNTQE